VSDALRDLQATVRTHSRLLAKLEQAAAARDEAIRRCKAEGVPAAVTVAVTGLSPQRVHQIVHRTR
jgi:hypothetical protein